MSLVVVGLNHRTVPVDLLERMAVAPDGLPKALAALSRREHLAEVVLLSTCNRTEIYAHATLFHPAMQDVRDFLADSSGVDPDEFADLLYAYHDDAAVAHLFGVAAGLDSMIIGEGEILGQVREAWQRGRARGRQRAAARRARSATRSRSASGPAPRPRIGRHAVSVSSAAVALATSRLGSLDDRRVLVLGAGEHGRGHGARARGRRRARDRRRQPHRVARARSWPMRVGGRAIPLERDPRRARSRATCCSRRPARSDLLVERSAIEAVMETPQRAGAARRRRRRAPRRRPRRGRGVRRDPARHRRPAGVRRAVAGAAPPGDRPGPRDHRRRARPPPGRAHRPARSRRSSPSLRARAEDVRAAELERYRAKLDALDPAARDAVEHAHPRHRQQAAARADRPPEGRGRHARAASCTPTRSSSCSACPSPTPTPTTDAPPAPRRDAGQRAGPLAGRAGRRVARRRRGARDRHDERRRPAPTCPIHAMGGTGVFVKEVQEAVLDGRADVAVHSAKDLPAVARPGGLVLAAVPERADPRDALVGSTLDALPAGGARRHRVGAAPRAARRAASGPHVRRAARQHPHPARARRRVRRDRGGRGRARAARPSSDRDRRVPRAVGDAARRSGQGALAVECRADDAETPRAARGDRRRARARGGRRRARVPRRSSAAAATCPCGALRDRRRRPTIVVDALLARADGRVVLRATRRATRARWPRARRVATRAARARWPRRCSSDRRGDDAARRRRRDRLPRRRRAR